MRVSSYFCLCVCVRVCVCVLAYVRLCVLLVIQHSYHMQPAFIFINFLSPRPDFTRIPPTSASHQSGYAGFLRDAMTVLPNTTERMLATSVAATWYVRAHAKTHITLIPAPMLLVSISQPDCSGFFELLRHVILLSRSVSQPNISLFALFP